jgi:hypothetical protein
MRLTRITPIATALTAVCVTGAYGFVQNLSARPQQALEPFVPVAVQYAPATSIGSDGIARDLQAIRAMGFNTIDTTIRWADSERAPGKYDFDRLGRVLTMAANLRLRVVVTIDDDEPDWIPRRHPDAWRVVDPETILNPPAERQICFDHSDIREALRSFVAAAAVRASSTASFLAMNVFGERPDGFCLCPYTASRAQEFALKGIQVRDDFLRMSVRDDLKLMVDASRGARTLSYARRPSILRRSVGEPPQDDWLMSPAVDRYGTSISKDMLPAERLALALDGIGGATRQRGWWMRADASIPALDRRFLGWAAISRGARMLSYEGLPERGTFEGIITRNAALFEQLKPVAAQIAVLHEPGDYSRPDARAISRVHAALFRANMPTDVVHVEESSATLGQYRALVVSSVASLSSPAVAAVKQFSANGGTVVSAVDRDPEEIVRLIKLAGVTPAVKIDGGGGMVETRFLESADVSMVIGLNHDSQPRKVTLTFTPDTQEAIWQNMETATGVNFVAGKDGPTYAYWFAPRDALVLMIRKNVR